MPLTLAQSEKTGIQFLRKEYSKSQGPADVHQILFSDKICSSATKPDQAELCCLSKMRQRGSSCKLSCDLVLHVSHEGSNLQKDQYLKELITFLLLWLGLHQQTALLASVTDINESEVCHISATSGKVKGKERKGM